MSRSPAWPCSLLGCALSLWACAEPVDGAARTSGEGARAASADRPVWITTGRDSLALIERVLDPATPPDARRAPPGSEAEVALPVPSDALAAISEAQHEQHQRCGGFIAHASEAEALQTLRALRQSRPKQTAAYPIDNDASVSALFSALREPNVLSTIRTLSAFRTRFHTSTTGREAATWIRDQWRALAAGRDDLEVALIDHENTPQPSIQLTVRGTGAAHELVILGGHMDSIAGRGSASALAPGADDNASGIATLTEIARAALELGYRPLRTVIFYAYAAEEVGLVGSDEIAAKAEAEGADVIGVMQLDMTNYTRARAPYIGLVTDYTDPALNAFSAALIERYLAIPYEYFECGYACSDHASWTNRGFAATFPNEATLGDGNPRIHTASDTLALSGDSAAHAMHFARFGAAFMAELAKGELAGAPGCDAGSCAAPERCDLDACAAEGDASAPRAGSCGPDATCAAGDAGARDAGRRRDASTADSLRDDERATSEASAAQDENPRAPGAEPTRDGGCRASRAQGAEAAWWCLLTVLSARRRKRCAHRISSPKPRARW